jgi:Zn-dependent protease
MDLSAHLVLSVVLQFAIVLLSLSVHESAHAWTADRLGDHTGRMLGRITLNPWPHVDVIGTILMPLILSLTGLPVFGWAKPVPVISRNLRHVRRDMALVGAAGPLSNLLLAVGVTLGLGLCLIVLGPVEFAKGFNWVNVINLRPVSALEWMGMLGSINLLLATFNLIPLPPLDGSWILSALLPAFAHPFFEGLRRAGPIILLVLLISGLLNVVISPLYKVLSLALMGVPLFLLSRILGS